MVTHPAPVGDAAPLTFEELLAAQDGVVTVHQVRPWLTGPEVRGEVDAGRWRRFCRGVVITHNAPPTRSQLRWAHLLGCPRGSALAGLTALAVDGLTGFEVAPTFVAIPAGARRPERQGLVPRWSTQLTSADVHPLRAPRRTRPARSVLDAASSFSVDRRCRAVVLAGVQQRLVRPADLRDALTRRGPCAQRGLIVESIDDAEGGIDSVPERDFDEVRRRYGLPAPDRQVVVRRTDGRYYLDAEWRRKRLAAEVHGIQHMELLSWDADLDRMGEVVAQGRRVIQFTSYAVRHQARRVGMLLRRAYEA